MAARANEQLSHDEQTCPHWNIAASEDVCGCIIRKVMVVSIVSLSISYKEKEVGTFLCMRNKK